MIGNLSGKTIKQLLNLGVVECRYGISETPAYLGDITSVYFFDSEGSEIAHQTMLSGDNTLGTPEANLYNRRWGDSVKAQYKLSHRWNMFLDCGREDIYDNSTYNIIERQ